MLADVPRADVVPGWNLYRPRWAVVAMAEAPDGTPRTLVLEDHDPYDYARAIRVFPESERVEIRFQVLAHQVGIHPDQVDGQGIRDKFFLDRDRVGDDLADRLLRELVYDVIVIQQACKITVHPFIPGDQFI